MNTSSDEGVPAGDGGKDGDPHGRGPRSVTLEIITEISAIDAAEWDACASSGDPFVSHAFLSALEESGLSHP